MATKKEKIKWWKALDGREQIRLKNRFNINRPASVEQMILMYDAEHPEERDDEFDLLSAKPVKPTMESVEAVYKEMVKAADLLPEEPKEGILGEKLFTEQQMRDCFNESRLTHRMAGFKHDTFEDYMKWVSSGEFPAKDSQKSPEKTEIDPSLPDYSFTERFNEPSMYPQPPEESAEVEKLKENIDKSDYHLKTSDMSWIERIILQNQQAMMSWMIANSKG